jgi:PAS domain S-box-containing protein
METFKKFEDIKILSEKISNIFKQNELLKMAINTSHEGIAILNEKGEYIYLNEAHAEMFGYSVDELIGKTWQILYKEKDVEYFINKVFPIIEQNGKWSGRYVGYAKNGNPVNEEVYLTSLPNGGLVCTCRVDICKPCNK